MKALLFCVVLLAMLSAALSLWDNGVGDVWDNGFDNGFGDGFGFGGDNGGFKGFKGFKGWD